METLIKIQAELKAPKNQKNTFGNYNYRSCEDILEAVKPLLLANNCLLTLNDEIEMVGSRVYIKSTATISCGTDIKCATGFAREEEIKKGMDGSQITGAASSYARKYALNALFLIDDNKDHDSKKPEEKETAEETIEVWKSQVQGIGSVEELELYWQRNKNLIKGDKSIIAVFTNRKKEINNVQVS